MEPNELRIGNYVSQGNKQGSVKAIYPKTVLIDFGNKEEVCDAEDLKPIPITEKWLLDFWFEIELTQVSTEFYIENFSIHQLIEREDFGVNVNGIDVMFNSVHHLQNFYFAVTGRELVGKS